LNIHDDFRDLAPLDPSRDAERWERMVAGITMAARPELARRARMPDLDLLQLLAGYVRPAVSAAALLAAAAGAVFFTAGPQAQQAPSAARSQVASALGYPGPAATWLDEGSTPSADELLTAMQAGEGR
jgi:hypothetical protein